MSLDIGQNKEMWMSPPDTQLIGNVRRFPGVVYGAPSLSSFSREYGENMLRGDLREPNTLVVVAKPATLKSTALRQIAIKSSFHAAQELLKRGGGLQEIPDVSQVIIRNRIFDWGSVFFAQLALKGVNQDVTGDYERTDSIYEEATSLWYEVVRDQQLKARLQQTQGTLVINSDLYELVSLTGLKLNGSSYGMPRGGRLVEDLERGAGAFGLPPEVSFKKPFLAGFESSVRVKDYVIDLREDVQKTHSPDERRAVLLSYGQELIVSDDRQVLDVQRRAASRQVIEEMDKQTAVCIIAAEVAGKITIPDQLLKGKSLSEVLATDRNATIKIIGGHYLPYLLTENYGADPERVFIGYNNRLLEQVTFHADLNHALGNKDVQITIEAIDAVEDTFPNLFFNHVAKTSD